MKKLLLLVINLFIINYTFINYSYGYSNCPSYEKIYNNLKNEESYNFQNYLNNILNKEYKNIYEESKIKTNTAWNDYINCIKEGEVYFYNGVDNLKKGNYEDSINNFKKYLNYNTDLNNENYKTGFDNLIIVYKNYINLLITKEDYQKAINYTNELINYDNKNAFAYMSLTTIYLNKNDYKNAKKYLEKAYEYNNDINLVKDFNILKLKIEEEEKNQELLKNAPTNDTYSGYQYYLKQLNIPNAWKKVTNNKEVIVAVIDDGVNINHPDLVNSIWTHPKTKYGDSKIIDFVGDGLPANLPVGEHGTMIAGIIGAKQNNNEGIAGIAKNVKFMPLRVFDSKGGAKEENIIKAIEYAIDNGANIINLSLGLSQFYYSDKYDTVIKKAFDKGVIVVIAAGNGDILSGKNTGINLTNNPISPVCNNTGKYKYSIGVYAVNKDWYRTNWTNYGNCADFFAPGEGIISTSIPVYNSNYGDNYNMADGTSFSAPIITGIIALGYNQYGYINPSDIYDALSESYFYYKLPGGENGKMLDVSKYIDILGEKVKKQQDNKKIIDNQNKQKQKAEVAFNQIKKKFSKLSETKRKTTYNSILKQLNGFKGKVKGDKEIILNHLIFLVNVELGNDFDLGDLFGE